MDDRVTQRKNAKEFIKIWKGYEKGEAQAFWISLLRDVLGVSQTNRIMEFEKKVVVGGQTNYIDAYIKPPMKILIEQKGSKIDLRKKYKQSDGAMLTPFEQAKRYASELGENLYPNYIVVCNFEEMHIHDIRNSTNTPPVVIKLEDLPDQIQRLAFLADADKELTAFEQKISVEAGEIVGQIYDALLEQYQDKTNPESLKSLNKLCVRLVFCLDAEDSGLFSTHLEFHDYLRKYSANARTALIQLFQILNTPEPERDRYLPNDLLAFPYVNGGLFADEDIEIPWITPQIVELILKKASEGFDWSRISPTIFGAVFESTLNPETRRNGGMHYTSVENIHKIIDPLFLDELKEELKAALSIKVPATRNKRLEEFRTKLGSLTFLDPACGSGNFLTETYSALRKLENEALHALYHGQMALGDDLSPIAVHINQFYGIEINDFAVTVARTALWIAESQMMKETADIVDQPLDFLPLKSAAHICEGNALVIDWNSVIPANKLNYVMGNPPFLGVSHQSDRQKSELKKLFSEVTQGTVSPGKSDYVTGWFLKCALFIRFSSVRCAFVATNSISQGEQVISLWKNLFECLNIHIDFAYTSFVWTNDSKNKAAVHVVIIGFSSGVNLSKKTLFTGTEKKKVANISPYLRNEPTVFIDSRRKPIFPVPEIKAGGKPVDGGFLIFSKENKEDFENKYPYTKQYFRPFVGSDDFLTGEYRYCLWLVNAPASILKKKEISELIEKVREFRLSSKKEATQALANCAYRFAEVKDPGANFLIIPATSSENRPYIPIGYLDKNFIPSNAASFIPGASEYQFGILTSSVHMAWMRAVAGRLKSDYRYSNTIVYNNFPWPSVSDSQKKKIEKTAKEILKVRASNAGSSLDELYNKSVLKEDLRKAHTANDKAVLSAYGFKPSMTEDEIVVELFKLYQARIKELERKEEKEKVEEATKK